LVALLAEFGFSPLVQQDEILHPLNVRRLVGQELLYGHNRREQQHRQSEQQILIPSQELHEAYLSQPDSPGNVIQAQGEA
jgi:hypothetical protein